MNEIFDESGMLKTHFDTTKVCTRKPRGTLRKYNSICVYEGSGTSLVLEVLLKIGVDKPISIVSLGKNLSNKITVENVYTAVYKLEKDGIIKLTQEKPRRVILLKKLNEVEKEDKWDSQNSD